METSIRKTILKRKIRLTKVRNAWLGLRNSDVMNIFYYFWFMFAFSAEISSRFINYDSDVRLFFANSHAFSVRSRSHKEKNLSQPKRDYQAITLVKPNQMKWNEKIIINFFHQKCCYFFVSTFLALNIISNDTHAKCRSKFARREWKNLIKNFGNFIWLCGWFVV